MKFHRDAPEAPTSPEERKKLVQWLMNHPVWTHPTTIKVPPGENPTVEDWNNPDESTWVEKTIPYGLFHDCLDLHFTYVNPKTDSVEDDESLNTEFQIWVEAGPWVDLSEDPDFPQPERGWDMYNRWTPVHDYNLDCGAATMEDALIELALRVKFFYNEDGTDADWQDDCGGHFEGEGEQDYHSHCVAAGDGFCMVCGYAVEEEE